VAKAVRSRAASGCCRIGRVDALSDAIFALADLGDVEVKLTGSIEGARFRFKNTGVHSARALFMFTPGGEEGVFRYGDEPQPGHPPPTWSPDRFRAPEIVKFSQDHGVEIVPE
jgi:hypothetical protein